MTKAIVTFKMRPVSGPGVESANGGLHFENEGCLKKISLAPPNYEESCPPNNYEDFAIVGHPQEQGFGSANLLIRGG